MRLHGSSPGFPCFPRFCLVASWVLFLFHDRDPRHDLLICTPSSRIFLSHSVQKKQLQVMENGGNRPGIAEGCGSDSCPNA